MTTTTLAERLAFHRDALHEHYRTFNTVQRDLYDAEAIYARLIVLELVEQHPSVVTIDLEWESLYDDEGSYFTHVTVSGCTADEKAVPEFDDEMLDVVGDASLSPESWELVAAKSITVDLLRKAVG